MSLIIVELHLVFPNAPLVLNIFSVLEKTTDVNISKKDADTVYDYLQKLSSVSALLRNNTQIMEAIVSLANKNQVKTVVDLQTQSLQQSSVKTQQPHTQNTRVAVVCYIPKGEYQPHHFLTMLFGSWRYITDKKDELVKNANNYHEIDLLAFCHPSICPYISHVCDSFNYTNGNMVSKCWAIPQYFEINIPYGPINSYIMFNRTDIQNILRPYKYILRTDFDVFITPALYFWVPSHKIMTGQGGYCDPFNMKRLKEISAKLGMRHQGVHCVGSTWYGETDLFIKLSKKTLELTAYMFLNEFDPNATGLETINFKKNREGEWVRWWRPVSSMYGAELALNDMIDNFSADYKGELDTPSCKKENVWTTPHIHCWHSDCEFQKFKFIRYLQIAINSQESLSGEIVNRILKNVYTRNVQNMSIVEYSTYIAWNSVSKYLRKWFKAR